MKLLKNIAGFFSDILSVLNSLIESIRSDLFFFVVLAISITSLIIVFKSISEEKLEQQQRFIAEQQEFLKINSECQQQCYPFVSKLIKKSDSGPQSCFCALEDGSLYPAIK
jgi:hypothetical protein